MVSPATPFNNFQAMPQPYPPYPPQLQGGSITMPSQGFMPPMPGGLPGMSMPQSPEMQRIYQQAFQDIMTSPQKRRAFLSLIQEAQQGKVPPEQIYRRMEGILSADGRGGRQKNFEPASASTVMKVKAAAILGVFGLSYAVARSMEGLEVRQNSLFERFLRGVDRLPGLRQLSQSADDAFEKIARQTAGKKSTKTSTLLNLDGAYYDATRLRRDYVQRHFGKDGFLAKEIDAVCQNLKPSLSSEQIKAIRGSLHGASRRSDVQRILNSELSAGERMLAFFSGQGALNRKGFGVFQHFLPDNLLGDLASHHAPLKLTLKELDQINVRNFLLKRLGEATYDKQVPVDVSRKLLAELQNPLASFAEVLEKQVLGQPHYDAVFATLFNGKMPQSYAALRQQLGLKPLWTYLNESSKGLLYSGQKQIALGATSGSTLGQLNRVMTRTHVSEQLKNLAPWRAFEKRIKGTLMRMLHYDSHIVPMLEAEFNVMRSLKSRGIGPVGRFLAKGWLNVSHMFQSGSFQRWSLNFFNRPYFNLNPADARLNLLGVALLAFILMASVKEGLDVPKEQRKAKLPDALTYGISAFYGFTLAQTLIPRIQMPKSLSWLNRVFVTKIPLIPLTIGGFLQYGILAGIIGDKVADVFRWPVNKIFGKPPKNTDEISDNMAATMNGPSLMPPPVSPYAMPPGGPLPFTMPSAAAMPGGMPLSQPSPLLTPAAQALTGKASMSPSAVSSIQHAPEMSPQQASATSPASASFPKVMYSTEGLGSVAALRRNRHQEKAQFEDDALMKKLKQIQREMS